MANIMWVKLLSWHAAVGSGPGWKTLCGRYVGIVPVRDTLPAEKSCEACLRIYSRSQDR